MSRSKKESSFEIIDAPVDDNVTDLLSCPIFNMDISLSSATTFSEEYHTALDQSPHSSESSSQTEFSESSDDDYPILSTISEDHQSYEHDITPKPPKRKINLDKLFTGEPSRASSSNVTIIQNDFITLEDSTGKIRAHSALASPLYSSSLPKRPSPGNTIQGSLSSSENTSTNSYPPEAELCTSDITKMRLIYDFFRKNRLPKHELIRGGENMDKLGDNSIDCRNRTGHIGILNLLNSQELNKETDPRLVAAKVAMYDNSTVGEDNAGDAVYQLESQNNQQAVDDSHVSREGICRKADLDTGSGIFHWFKKSSCVNKLVSKAKTSFNFLITVLDPGMTDFLHKDDYRVPYVLVNDKKEFWSLERGFEDAARSSLEMMKDMHISNLPVEPVGFASGLACAERRVAIARIRNPDLAERLLIALAPVLFETSPQRWHCCTCVLLNDPRRQLQLHLFTQSTPVPTQYIAPIQSLTSEDYFEKYQGYAHSFREATKSLEDWESVVSGISRYTMLESVARALCEIYYAPVDYL